MRDEQDISQRSGIEFPISLVDSGTVDSNNWTTSADTYTSVRAITHLRPQAPAHLEDLLQIVTDNLQAIWANYKLFSAYDRCLVQEIIDHLITIHIQISIWGLKEKAHYLTCDNQLEQFVENSIIDIQN